MPTQLQLEGPDLETLLSRVKAEHGPGARIVRAEKVRTGGVAGFFAKERFELCVELDVEPGTRPVARQAPAQLAPLLDMPHAATPSAATSLLDLADEVSAAELSTHSRSGGVAQRRSTDRPADDRPLPAPPVSTETRDFASILARLGVAAGPAEESLRAPAAAAPAAAPLPAPAPSAGSGFRAFEAFDREAVAPAAPPYVAPPGAELPSFPRQRAGTEPGTAVTVRQTAEIAVTGVERASRPLTGVGGQLVELGLPEHLLPVPAAGPVYPSLVQSLRRLPKVPRATNRAGGVLVVVGPQALALEVAREIARDLKLPVATAVVLATARRGRADLPAKQVIRSADAAVERRTAWRRRRNLTIVAIDAPLTAAGAATARTFLTALQPSATWGVVEATRKAHDVGRWARALGGVDALALAAVEETADPASVLTLGIPVGRLGAAKATPAAWAALLTDRMAA